MADRSNQPPRPSSPLFFGFAIFAAVVAIAFVAAPDREAPGDALPLYDSVLASNAEEPRAVIVDVLRIPPGDGRPAFERLVQQLNRSRLLPGELRVSGFDRSDGRLIATVELDAGGAEVGRDAWYQSLQGSTGAYATELELGWNLLQPHYAGAWPDGIRLRYRGEPMPVLDHVDLSGTLTRDRFRRR
ncbi:MAG: hypothetical protein ACOC0E_03705 [Spirochaetota bacterium]